MFNFLPNHLKSYLFPKIGTLEKNYFYLQFTSMKIIPAFFIVIKNLKNKKINKNTTIIESSSGNFAYGLALICNFFNIKLIIVGDKGIDENLENKLKLLNTKVIIVGKSTSIKNIQTLRLKELKKQISKTKNNFWPKQYDNEDNINSYSILEKFLSKNINLKNIDMLICPVGSGGSSAGFYQILKKFNPKINLIGVDSVNSVIFGNSVGKRMLRGPGSSIFPKNVRYQNFSKVFWVSDADAYTTGIDLYKKKGFNSSPCVGAVHLVANYLNKKLSTKKILTIFPETGERYSNSLYNYSWLKKNKLIKKKINNPILVTKNNNDIKKFSYINWNNKEFK